MRLTLIFLFLCTLCRAQSFTVSENKRYLLKDQKPFIWIGDTAWELFHALNRDSAEYYLSKRAEQGFTVIQAVVLAELDGLNTPNAYGHTPLVDLDPTRPDEAYFKHVDFVIDKAGELGLTLALLPTWGDKLFKSSWGKGPEIFHPQNAYQYGRWIGNRYKDRKNIIWVLGGDRNPRKGSDDVEVWRAMARGIEEGAGGPEMALITFHPQPNEEGASEWFPRDSWLDVNMFQTGHCRDEAVYRKLFQAWNRLPHKPVLDGEPIYEDHPVCFNAGELGTSGAYDIRKAVYLGMFAGGFGVTYGCHSVWQMNRPGAEPVNNPHYYWYQALDLPGANQMKHLKKLIASRPVLDRIPDQSLIEENNYDAHQRVQATRGKDYAFIYTAYGNPFTLNPGKIAGKTLRVQWYNPRTGESTDAGEIENSKKHVFTPPTTGYGHDWVLVLDGKG